MFAVIIVVVIAVLVFGYFAGWFDSIIKSLTSTVVAPATSYTSGTPTYTSGVAAGVTASGGSTGGSTGGSVPAAPAPSGTAYVPPPPAVVVPAPSFNVGDKVKYYYKSPVINSAIGITAGEVMTLVGEVCAGPNASGKYSVKWQSMSNPKGSVWVAPTEVQARSVGTTVDNWINQWLGKCGVKPLQFTQMPDNFAYGELSPY